MLGPRSSCHVCFGRRTVSRTRRRGGRAGPSIAEEHWTVDESFPGTKIIFAGRYTLRRGEFESRTPACQCEQQPLPPRERFIGTFGGHLQWGQGYSDVDYGTASFTSWAWKRDLSADAAHEPPRETWGSIYLEQRVENGWTFSSPARGGPVSRAAVYG